MAAVLLLLLALATADRSRADQCTSESFWYSWGKASPTSNDWSSYGANSRFQKGPCLQVSGFHVIQFPQTKKIIVIDRTDTDATYMRLGNGFPSWAVELTPGSGAQRALNVITNTFCSTGQIAPDGTFLSIGGSWGAGAGVQGGDTAFYSIRALKPCAGCDFQIVGRLASKRWYPSSQILADGRILIVGGSTDSSYMGYENINNPTLEYWPRSNGQATFTVNVLRQAVPYALYPIVHLLPSGKVFIFANQRYSLWDTGSNKEVGGNTPSLDVRDAWGSRVIRNYPNAGSSAMFPLSSGSQYKAEIMICGGNSENAANPNRGAARGDYPADDKCWRIAPEAPNPRWIMESMTYGRNKAARVMGDMVLLVDGSVLILNGAQQGYQSFPNAAHKPCLQPLIYQPWKYQWYPKDLAASKVPRMYHSNAILLHDATVFISGSNPNSMNTPSSRAEFPTEFRTEYFYPPYFYTGKQQPDLLTAPASIRANQQFQITFRAYQTGNDNFKRFKAVLCYPGLSTHGLRHGMRNVELVFVSFNSYGASFTATLRAPPSLNIAPPTFYFLHILDNGVPNKSALTVQMQK